MENDGNDGTRERNESKLKLLWKLSLGNALLLLPCRKCEFYFTTSSHETCSIFSKGIRFNLVETGFSKCWGWYLRNVLHILQNGLNFC